MFLRIIGICWMVVPFLVLLIPNGDSGELFPYGLFSFICGFLLYKAAPKNKKQSVETFKPNIESKIENISEGSNENIRRFENEDHEKYIPKSSLTKIKSPNNIDEKIPLTDINEIPEALVTQRQKLNIKRVGYSVNFKDEINLYPKFIVPKLGCIVRSHSEGKKNRRGFKEQYFQNLIEEYFRDYFYISGSIILTTGNNTRPYEPDIAMIGKSNLNIRIDVEIDEPYVGISRKPTHCIGEDVQRDRYFKDRGWIVIRFTEFQVHTQPIACLNILYRFIKKIDKSINTKLLEKSNSIKRENAWDLLQAQQWERSRYRENYLNHEFNEQIEPYKEYDNILTDNEKQEELLVENSYVGELESRNVTSYNSKNYNWKRDNRIQFYPTEHKYIVDGIDFQSVSTLVNKFFPEFNAVEAAQRLNTNHPLYGFPIDDIVRKWKQNGEKSAAKGTFLHLQIEKYFLDQDFEELDEFAHFREFLFQHQKLQPYRSEWRIFDSKFGCAGTIDLLAKEDNKYVIYDWKRSKKLIDENGNVMKTNSYNQKALGLLNHIPDTSYHRYCLQQSLYKYILEKNYNLSIAEMFLIVLHPKYNTYYKTKVPYMKDEVLGILNAI